MKTGLMSVLALGSVLLLGAQGGVPGAGKVSRERFREPPPENRILKIIHGWPDEPSVQDAWLGSLVRQGFGGVVCNVSFENYLEGEPQWMAFQRAVARAREAGLSLWLYDERGYPSGTAGGLVLKEHPEWQARGLLIDDRMVTGEGEVRWQLPPGEVERVVAYPVTSDGNLAWPQRIDLGDQVADGELTWKVPSGRWQVLAVTESPLYDGTHAAMNLDAKLPYPNLLSPGPTRRFLELTHEAYARHFEEPLGEWFVATFTDEPSLMSLFLRSMPYRVLPWDATLAGDYRRRFGRPLDLEALVLDQAGHGPRARYEFWQLVGERVAENFFGQIQNWCRNESLPSGGHLLMEENLAAQVPLYGDFFACLRRLDVPGIDCLTSLPSAVPWSTARVAWSAAVLEGGRTTMCEVSDHSQRYRPKGDARPQLTVTEAQVRGTLNRLLAGGINTFTSYYSFAGLSEEAVRRLNDYVGRCTLLLREGEPAAEVAVVWPVESLWTRTFPGRGVVSASPGVGVIGQTFAATCEQLFASHREFLCIDSQTLVQSELGAGSLSHGDQRWSVIVLPAVDTLPQGAWDQLKGLVEQGGVLIALGVGPANSSAAFPSREVARISEAIFGPLDVVPVVRRHPSGGLGIFLPAGSVGFLAELVDQVLDPVVRVEPDAPVRLAARRLETGHRLFLINDSDQTWKGKVVADWIGDFELWDPITGIVHTGFDTASGELELEPYGAVFLYGKRGSSPRALLSRTPVLPAWTEHPLPVRTPGVGRGEFVRETIQEDADADPIVGGRWRASARLTRGQVDTFLFLMFELEDAGQDLSRGSCLVFDSLVPEGQRTPSELLVILKEVGGAEYLASTGRSLGWPGKQRTHLFWGQFQLAGWSRDDNARLDLDRISELRVGWGGYYGREGERVEFSVGVPRLATGERSR